MKTAKRSAAMPQTEKSAPPVPLHGSEPMTLWFDKPAEVFHEACPLGNGRLGAMDFGGTSTLRIVLNESSVWTGGPYDGNRYDAHECLSSVREKLFAGDIAGAQAEIERRFGYADGIAGCRDRDQFGCYQTLGDLTLVFPTAAAAPGGYRRELDVMTGISATRYTLGGTTFTHQLAVSKPDEVIALRIRTDRPGSLAFTASLSRRENAAVAPDGGFQRMQGPLPFNAPAGVPGEGVKYMVRCPFSLERILKLTPEGRVIYKSEHSQCRPFPDSGSLELRPGVNRNFELFEPLEFIAEITQHIPEPHAQTIRYYGWYSNKSRGQRRRPGNPIPGHRRLPWRHR